MEGIVCTITWLSLAYYYYYKLCLVVQTRYSNFNANVGPWHFFLMNWLVCSLLVEKVCTVIQGTQTPIQLAPALFSVTWWPTAGSWKCSTIAKFRQEQLLYSWHQDLRNMCRDFNLGLELHGVFHYFQQVWQQWHFIYNVPNSFLSTLWYETEAVNNM